MGGIMEKAGRSLRLLTLNTHKGFSALNSRFVLHELREAVRAVDADLVFLQEVLGAHRGHAKRHANWPGQPQYQFLAEAIWGSVAYGRNAVYEEGDHGNAVLSRFPITRYRNHDISLSRLESRGVLHCELEVPDAGHAVHAVCTHLSLRGAHRQLQFKQLCTIIHAEVPREAALFVAGDFNDWRGQAHQVLLREAELKEAFVQGTGRAALSFPARLPVLQLDRIYYRNASIHSCNVLRATPWTRLSDHLPLVAEAMIP
jgi:endonuclease/exonuclease/phosphatase family metal-dependent hydrolase